MCPVGVVFFSRIGVHSEAPSPQRGARCLSSLSEKLSGWHWSRDCLLYSLCTRFFRMFSRVLALISSSSLEVARRLLAMWLEVCRLDMCSSSAPVMF